MSGNQTEDLLCSHLEAASAGSPNSAAFTPGSVWLLLSAQWSGTLEGPLKKCGAGSHAALTPPLHHLTEPTHPGSGDSDPESDFPVQKDLLPVGRGADRGIVLPSSGSSGNKNLSNN